MAIENVWLGKPEKPKKKFWQVLKKIALFILPMVLKNQKGIKGTPNENKVDKATEILDEL